jgi:hypothetical protein
MAADPRSLPSRDGYPTFSVAEIIRRHAVVCQALHGDDLGCMVL